MAAWTPAAPPPIPGPEPSAQPLRRTARPGRPGPAPGIDDLSHSAPVWKVTEFRGPAGLEQLAADWHRLCAEMPARTSFIAFETCVAYVNHLMAEPAKLRCLAISDCHQRVRAICPLEPRTDRRLGFPVRVWGVLWHPHGHQADVVCPDDQLRRELIPVLAAHLRHKPEGRRLLVLGPAPGASPLWDGMGRMPPGDCCVDPRESASVLDCRGTYQDLVRGLTRNHRHALNSARRRLAALEAVRFVTARKPAELAAEFSTFLEVEASGWKGAGGTLTAVKFRGGQPAFFRALAGSLHGPEDHCEISAIYAQGQCLASAIGTRTGATYSGLKIAFNPAFGRMSPGKLLFARILERCCEDPDIQRIDLVRTVPWLSGWAPEPVPLQLAYVNLGRWPRRLVIALLRLRVGPLRRWAGRLRATRLWPRRRAR